MGQDRAAEKGTSRSPGSLLQRLKQRKVGQWGLAYLGGAWLLLQVLHLLGVTYGWPSALMRSFPVLLAVGFLAALVVAWYHGEKGQQRVSGAELVILAALLVIGGAGVALVATVEPTAASTEDPASPPLAPADAAADRQSVAVLPFANLSADPEQEYFSDGLTEELLTVLAQIPELRVAARTSSFAFKGQRVPVDSVGRALRVAHVLEGSVRRSGNRLRITAQLTDAASGYQLWSQTFERQLADVFQIQDEISRAIAQALRMRLPVGGGGRTASRHATDPETYQLYLRGRFALNLRTREALEQAASYFRQAHGRDPAFAPALAGLADAYLLLTEFGWMPRAEGFPQAIAAAQQALAADDALAEAQTSAGYALYWTRDFRAAERAFRRAIELNPSAAAAHQWYAELLLTLGRADEAVREMTVAQELDPLSPRLRVMLGYVLMRARRYDEALFQYQRVADTEPFALFIHWGRALAYAGKGMYEAALTESEMARARDPTAWATWRLPDHAYILVRKGHDSQARILLEQYRQEAQGAPNYASGMARLYAALEERDHTLEWLERSFAEDPTLLLHQTVSLKTNVVFDFLRADPRFERLLRRMELE